MQRRTWPLAPAVCVALLLVTGCTSTDSDSAGPSPEVTPSSAQAEVTGDPGESSSGDDAACIGALAPATEAPEPGEFTQVEDYHGLIQCQMSSGLLLTGFALKRIDDRTDRLTMEYADPDGSTSGGPGVWVEPVASAHYPARTEEMDFDGEAIALFSILGVSWKPGGDPNSGIHEPAPTGGPIVDVYYFEGTGGAHGLYVGVTSSDVEIRTHTDTAPYRVVIEVRSP